jgi:hypothetical protein
MNYFTLVKPYFLEYVRPLGISILTEHTVNPKALSSENIFF